MLDSWTRRPLASPDPSLLRLAAQLNGALIIKEYSVPVAVFHCLGKGKALLHVPWLKLGLGSARPTNKASLVEALQYSHMAGMGALCCAYARSNVARRGLVRGQCRGCNGVVGLKGGHPWSPFARLVFGRAFGTDALVVPCNHAMVTTHCTRNLLVTQATFGEKEALLAIVSRKSLHLANGKATLSRARPQPQTRSAQ